jgi:hypothetical protein
VLWTLLQRLGEVPGDVWIMWVLVTTVGAFCLRKGMRKAVNPPDADPWSPEYDDGPSTLWWIGAVICLGSVAVSISQWLVPELGLR